MMNFFNDIDALLRYAEPPRNPSAEPLCNFPLPWYESFLKRIVELNINVVTYRELFDGLDDFDHVNSFPVEYKHWTKTCPKDRPTLIIQHDVDKHPFFTQRMIALEQIYGIKSNIFMFVQPPGGKVRQLAYQIDHEFFIEAEKLGFVIAYHQDALQLCDFNLEEAAGRFVQDVNHLRSIYQRIEFVVPHGGKGGEWNGQQVFNYSLGIPPDLNGNIRWVYNKYGMRMARRWSDGGLRRSTDKKLLKKFDIMNDFLDTLKPGTRSFCLVHPQRWGFHLDTAANPILEAQPWYQQVCTRYGEKCVTKKAGNSL